MKERSISTPWGRKQAGFAFPGVGSNSLDTKGLIVRGVVLATYVQGDNSLVPDPGFGNRRAAIYCDVLAYSSIPGAKFNLLPNCLVATSTGGVHDDRMWVPRPSTVDFEKVSLDELTSNPGTMDGDHVLISFLDGDLQNPIIIGAVPHPLIDTGNENQDLGHRIRINPEDGTPAAFKHRGSWCLIDSQGNITVDTTRAHDGVYDGDGNEQPKEDGDHGNVTFTVAENATVTIRGQPAPTQEGAQIGNPTFELTLKENEFEIRLNNGDSLKVNANDGNATVQVGDGTHHVAIVEPLEALYASLNLWLDTHVHPEAALRSSLQAAGVALNAAGVDPTLVGLAQTAAAGLATAGLALQAAASSLPDSPSTDSPDWDGAINSTKVSLPDG